MRLPESHLLLIGFRGTGKSTLACQIAEATDRPVIDLDREIESDRGKSIALIFEREGESAFREYEQIALERALDQTVYSIIATGGGLVERAVNRDTIQHANARVVWLQARPETIRERMVTEPGGIEQRPSITGSHPLEEIETLLRRRTPLYRKLANLTLVTDGRSPKELTQIVLDRLRGV